MTTQTEQFHPQQFHRRFAVLHKTILGSIITSLFIFFCGNGLLSAQETATKSPINPAIKVAKRCLQETEKVEAFTASFLKQEVVDGKLQPQARMTMKWRAKPFSVYLKFVDPHEGREVIYVDGKNDGKLLVHVTGLKSIVGTLALEPTSDRVMAESRYPITNSGLTNMVKGVIAQWEKEREYGDIKVKYYKKAKLNGRPCRVIETSHSTNRKEFKFHMTRLYIDAKTILPVRVEQYGFPTQKGGKPPRIELYEYSSIKTDVKLNDIDFNTKNPAYDY